MKKHEKKFRVYLTHLMTQQLDALLSDLLVQLSSDDNAVRSAAEAQLQQHWAVHQPSVLLLGLATLAATSPSPHVNLK